MTKNNIKSKSGFTIIEVVLVLAIAGLIFLMVFIAFPGLQRSQRDTQRRNDLANLATRIIDYQTNNRNNVPSGDNEWASFQTNYFGDFVDPDGNPYKIVEEEELTSNTDSTAKTDGKKFETDMDQTTHAHPIHVFAHAHCDGEKAVYDLSPRKVAFVYILESGNVYCGEN